MKSKALPKKIKASKSPFLSRPKAKQHPTSLGKQVRQGGGPDTTAQEECPADDEMESMATGKSTKPRGKEANLKVESSAKSGAKSKATHPRSKAIVKAKSKQPRPGLKQQDYREPSDQQLEAMASGSSPTALVKSQPEKRIGLSFEST